MDKSAKEIAALKKENEELKKLIAFRSDLISLSAHHMRTSLSAVRWILKMLIDKDFGELTKEQDGMIGRAFESSGRMVEQINEMLALGHKDTSNFEYKFEKTDIISLIDSVLFDFTGESFKNGIEIIFLKPDTELPKFVFDREKIRVVLQNLVENAIRYSNKGDKVFISVAKKEKAFEVSVRDTGIGITEEGGKSVFEKFYRTKEAIEKEPHGTGVGLYTSKRIVEDHGGKIWFENMEGHGTTFSFTIPLSLPEML